MVVLDELNAKGREVKNEAGQARRDVRTTRETLISSDISYGSLTDQIATIDTVIAALQQEIRQN